VTTVLKRKKQDSTDEPISLDARRPIADPVDPSSTDPDPIETVDVALQGAVQTVEAGVEEEETADDGESSDLLSMFTETRLETVDHTLLVKMAGDVDIDDVVAELQLIAAALNLGAADLREAA
jgi:hypothetical protein